MKKIIYLCLLVIITFNLKLFGQINSGLVAYYPFNGNANDESGNGNNGIINGAILTPDRFENINSAYNFNGINNNIYNHNPNFSFNYNLNFSVSVWVKLDSLDLYNNRIFVWSGNASPVNFVWTLHIYQGMLTFGATKQGWDWDFAQFPSSNLNTSEWYNITAVFENRNMLLYKNGIQVANSYFRYNDSQQTILPLSIGATCLNDNNFIDYFNGKLDEIRIYNKALSQTEITQLYTGICILNLSVIPQGYYNSFANRLYKKDSVDVYLRQSFPPYTIIDSSAALVDSINFTGTFNINFAPTDSYYIIAKHKNCIETWSNNPVNIIRDTIVNYKFTSSLSQAYLDNMIQVDDAPIRFGLYSGDVNKNGFIDLDDLIPIYNDATNFLTGNYLITDLTGDRFVDLNDVTICYNNSINFIVVKQP